jgi:hypothetical protein
MDPNVGFWVCNEAMKSPDMTPKALAGIASQMDDGLKTLQGYALRRKNIELLAEIKNK